MWFRLLCADGKEKIPGSKVFMIPYNASNTISGTSPQVNAQDVTTGTDQELLYYITYYTGKSFLYKMEKE